MFAQSLYCTIIVISHYRENVMRCCRVDARARGRSGGWVEVGGDMLSWGELGNRCPVCLTSLARSHEEHSRGGCQYIVKLCRERFPMYRILRNTILSKYYALHTKLFFYVDFFLILELDILTRQLIGLGEMLC